MVKIEKIVFVGKNLKVGMNMIELHERVKKQIKNYSHLIKLVKRLEGKKALKTKRVGRDSRITYINFEMFSHLESVLKLAK